MYNTRLLSNNMPRKWFPYKNFISMFPEWETQRLLTYNKKNLGQCSQSTPIKEGKIDFNETVTSHSEKLLSSVIESASDSQSHNLSFSDNETMPDSPIKPKRKQTRIQLLCPEDLSEEQPPNSYERKLDTVENIRNNEADDTEKCFEKAEEEEQDIHLQIDSKKKAAMFNPLKVVKQVLVIEINDE